MAISPFTSVISTSEVKDLFERILEMRSLTAIQYLAEDHKDKHDLLKTIAVTNDLDTIWMYCAMALGHKEKTKQIKAWLEKKGRYPSMLPACLQQ